MSAPGFLVLQTAFIGDLILTLPLVQTIRSRVPDARIVVVAIPSTIELLAHHPAITEALSYDKKASQAGLSGVLELAGEVKSRRLDIAIIPHRSLRSAAVPWLARIPKRIGFSASAGRFLLTDAVAYETGAHEVTRDLSLLEPLGMTVKELVLPSLYPDDRDRDRVDDLIETHRRIHPGFKPDNLIAMAPGSVWNTKRWPMERYAALGKLLEDHGFSIALVGGPADVQLCSSISGTLGTCLNAAGKLSLLQSADLIGRCRAIVTNDSAPMHLGVAMRVPVAAIFGATVPRFGFAPIGEHDVVVETKGLPCRPCSIHGGHKCPIKTFECMNQISPEHVLEEVLSITSPDPSSRG